MNGILRNTLRIVGTAKYAPNNSTKYLRSMTLGTNRLNNLLGCQAKQISTNFWTTILLAVNKTLSVFVVDEIKTSSFGYFEVSLTSSKINLRLMTPNRLKNLILPPTFSTELNEKSIEPKSNNIAAEEDEKLSFQSGEWNVSLNGNELKLKVSDTDKTFILKHAVYVKAHKNPPKTLEDGGVVRIQPKLDNGIISYPAKITSKTNESGELHREYPPLCDSMPWEQFLHYGVPSPDPLPRTSDEEITDKPNSFGKVKLQFPMAVFLKGPPQKIKLKDSDDDFTVYHTVDIQAFTESLENSQFMTWIGKDQTSKIGILRMALDSGDITIKSTQSPEQTIIIRQEVDIVIDLDSKIPSILVSPFLKSAVSIQKE